jgi:hypothetical protein
MNDQYSIVEAFTYYIEEIRSYLILRGLPPIPVPVVDFLPCFLKHFELEYIAITLIEVISVFLLMIQACLDSPCSEAFH